MSKTWWVYCEECGKRAYKSLEAQSYYFGLCQQKNHFVYMKLGDGEINE